MIATWPSVVLWVVAQKKYHHYNHSLPSFPIYPPTFCPTALLAGHHCHLHLIKLRLHCHFLPNQYIPLYSHIPHSHFVLVKLHKFWQILEEINSGTANICLDFSISCCKITNIDNAIKIQQTPHNYHALVVWPATSMTPWPRYATVLGLDEDETEYAQGKM